MLGDIKETVINDHLILQCLKKQASIIDPEDTTKLSTEIYTSNKQVQKIREFLKDKNKNLRLINEIDLSFQNIFCINHLQVYNLY